MHSIDLKKLVNELFRPRSPKRPEGYKEAAARLLFARQLAAYQWSIPYVSGRRVLEVGSNRGYGLGILKAHAHHIVGIELSERLARIAHTETGVPVVRANGEQLPFVDNSFDVVVSFQVIEHVWDDRACVAEIARVLAPDGVLIVTTPYRPGRLFEGEVPRFEEHLREYDSVRYADLMNSAFSDVEVMGLYAEDHAYQIERMRTWRRAEEFYFIGWATFPVRQLSRLARALRRRPRADVSYIKNVLSNEVEDLVPRFKFGHEKSSRWDHLLAMCSSPKVQATSPDEQAWTPTEDNRTQNSMKRRVARALRQSVSVVEPALAMSHLSDSDALHAVKNVAATLKADERLAFLDGPLEVRDAGVRLRSVNFWRQALPLCGMELDSWIPAYRYENPVRELFGIVRMLADDILLRRMPWLARLGIIVAKRVDTAPSSTTSQSIDEIRSQQHTHEECARRFLPSEDEAFLH